MRCGAVEGRCRGVVGLGSRVPCSFIIRSEVSFSIGDEPEDRASSEFRVGRPCHFSGEGGGVQASGEGRRVSQGSGTINRVRACR